MSAYGGVGMCKSSWIEVCECRGLGPNNDKTKRRYTTMYEYNDSELRTEISKQIRGKDITSVHFLEVIALEIEQAMSDIGLEVDLLNFLEADCGEAGENGLKITPYLPENVHNTLFDSFAWLQATDDVKGYFNHDDASGSSNVTAWVVNNDLCAYDAILALQADENEDGLGQIERMCIMASMMADRADATARELTAYCLWRFAAGWYAERMMAMSGDWSKGTESQDKGGIDLFGTGPRHYPKGYQVKPMTTYARGRVRTFENSDQKYLFYMWTPNGIVAGLVDEEENETGAVKKEAAQQSRVSYKTELYTTTDTGSMKGLGRKARLLW